MHISGKASWERLQAQKSAHTRVIGAQAIVAGAGRCAQVAARHPLCVHTELAHAATSPGARNNDMAGLWPGNIMPMAPSTDVCKTACAHQHAHGGIQRKTKRTHREKANSNLAYMSARKLHAHARTQTH